MDDHDTPEIDDVLGSEDHLRSGEVYLGKDCFKPGTIIEVAGFGLYLLDSGVWRVHESADAIQASLEDDTNEGYLDTIDPSQFPTANHLYDYLRSFGAHINDDTEEREDTSADHRPEVH